VASKAEFKIPRVNSHHAGEYYCVANNSYRHFTSRPVTINVKGAFCQVPSERNGLSNHMGTLGEEHRQLDFA
jgi:hypothetical protein